MGAPGEGFSFSRPSAVLSLVLPGRSEVAPRSFAPVPPFPSSSASPATPRARPRVLLPPTAYSQALSPPPPLPA